MDYYEQEMASVRAEIDIFVKQFGGDEEQEALKRLHKKELLRMQAKVNKLLERMEKVRAEAAADEELHLTSAQVDELFTAMPPTWSFNTRINMAWAVIAISVVMNVVALVYKIAG